MLHLLFFAGIKFVFMKEALVFGKRASSNWLRKQRVWLDVKNKTYKNEETVFGVSFGNWKKLPALDYILIFKTVYVKCEACHLEDFEDEAKGIYQVSLVHHKSRKIIIHESKNKEEVFALATRIGAELNLPVRDSASNRRKAVWIKRETIQMPVS